MAVIDVSKVDTTPGNDGALPLGGKDSFSFMEFSAI